MNHSSLIHGSGLVALKLEGIRIPTRRLTVSTIPDGLDLKDVAPPESGIDSPKYGGSVTGGSVMSGSACYTV